MQQACHLIAGAHDMERTQQKLGDDTYECIQTDSNKITSKTVPTVTYQLTRIRHAGKQRSNAFV